MPVFGTARTIALAFLALTIGISLFVDSEVPRTVAIGVSFVAAWGLYEMAARSRLSPDAGARQVGPDRRRNPLLRTLTDQMLVQVRELYRIADGVRAGERTRAQGDAEIERLERDMVDLVRKMKRSAAHQYEGRNADA